MTQYSKHSTSKIHKIQKQIPQPHTDVYKRQTVGSGMELTGAGIPLFHERTRSVSNMTSSKMELTEAVTQQCQETVSYTHLDVYKRQVVIV